MPSDREYELVYIVAPTATDAEVEALQGEVSELVQKSGGSVENTDVWGRRKLAYEIGHHNEGIYIVQLLEGPGEMIAELGRRLRVRDQVLRHLTVRVDEDLRKVRRAAEKKKATAQRRRAARGKPPLPEADSAPAASVSPGRDGVGTGDTAVPATDAGATSAAAETAETSEVQK
ncbi:MAG: 30S ribosomal protein S6 [Acidobacteria bacterium]|jgi:small subunit ribosomal protein S6|nr:30S ribosomal protein S6 [Acidobacteriota bacterium]MDP7478095.1 30S ribosomal protein S6 [Vicinamibacterales bacterium]MDP7692264.1 30S ribosomal protein S6 [Vicinamibacterales bacterium]HJN43257.1 30S ribosomal protein S6 [Vicinamibacterales bacterium]|tara:strand:- start:185 stop:706 length:522 start_codon:yes stop_codon:yes gene_type:complete